MVVLTEKDADYIISYLRTELANYSENTRKVKEIYKKMYADELKKNEDGMSEEERSIFRIIGDIASRELAESIKKVIEERHKMLLRSIELLTVGSEHEEE